MYEPLDAREIVAGTKRLMIAICLVAVALIVIVVCVVIG